MHSDALAALTQNPDADPLGGADRHGDDGPPVYYAADVGVSSTAFQATMLVRFLQDLAAHRVPLPRDGGATDVTCHGLSDVYTCDFLVCLQGPVLLQPEPVDEPALDGADADADAADPAWASQIVSLPGTTVPEVMLLLYGTSAGSTASVLRIDVLALLEPVMPLWLFGSKKVRASHRLSGSPQREREREKRVLIHTLAHRVARHMGLAANTVCAGEPLHGSRDASGP